MLINKNFNITKFHCKCFYFFFKPITLLVIGTLYFYFVENHQIYLNMYCKTVDHMAHTIKIIKLSFYWVFYHNFTNYKYYLVKKEKN